MGLLGGGGGVIWSGIVQRICLLHRLNLIERKCNIFFSSN